MKNLIAELTIVVAAGFLLAILMGSGCCEALLVPLLPAWVFAMAFQIPFAFHIGVVLELLVFWALWRFLKELRWLWNRL